MTCLNANLLIKKKYKCLQNDMRKKDAIIQHFYSILLTMYMFHIKYKTMLMNMLTMMFLLETM